MDEDERLMGLTKGEVGVLYDPLKRHRPRRRIRIVWEHKARSQSSRPTNFVSLIRNIVREQVHEAIQGLLGGTARSRKKAANRRRRRRRRRGPRQPPGFEDSKGPHQRKRMRKRRGSGRPPKQMSAGSVQEAR